MICQTSASSGIDSIYKEYVASNFSVIHLSEVLSALPLDSPKFLVWKHPLGFFHAELTPFVPTGANERFRFHFWLNSGGPLDSLGNLHEHTWHLSSLVLAGKISDTTLRASPADAGEYSGSRIIYGRENTSETVGRFDLDILESRIIPAGSHYSIPSRTVHLNGAQQYPAVTLVRSIEDETGRGPLVLTRTEETQGLPTSVREPVNPTEIISLLAKRLKHHSFEH